MLHKPDFIKVSLGSSSSSLEFISNPTISLNHTAIQNHGNNKQLNLTLSKHVGKLLVLKISRTKLKDFCKKIS